MFNHYIKVNDAGDVIKIYSNAYYFVPIEGDILLNEEAEDRKAYITINGEKIYNPSLTKDCLYIYKWTGTEILPKTQEEIYTPEVLAEQKKGLARSTLRRMQPGIMRVDDVINILKTKGVITDEDIPQVMKDNIKAIEDERKNLN